MAFLERLKRRQSVKHDLRKARVERRQIGGLTYVWVSGIGDPEAFRERAQSASVEIPGDIATALQSDIDRRAADRRRAALLLDEVTADPSEAAADVVTLEHKWGRY